MAKRILIVDDSSMMRKIIKKTLGTEGFEVIGEAKSGEEAIELYRELHPDAVTMDITMRGMDGISAAEEIRKIDDGAKVLFLSNLDEDQYRDEVTRVGGIAIVNKHKSQEILDVLQGIGD